VLGGLLVLAGADVALASRVRASRLPLAGRVVGVLALGWAVRARPWCW
jgi:hypothetical protein